MPRGRTAKVLTHRYDGRSLTRRPDQLIVEEPLEIQLDGVLAATTMRTWTLWTSWQTGNWV